MMALGNEKITKYENDFIINYLYDGTGHMPGADN